MSALAQALSVLVIGGIGAYIAWRQWRTAHDRLKLDLFDRRLAAYQRLKDAVAPISASGKVTNEDTDRFARAMYDMRFLFDKETETCVDQIYCAMLDKHTIDAQLERTRARNKEIVAAKRNEFGRAYAPNPEAGHEKEVIPPPQTPNWSTQRPL